MGLFRRRVTGRHALGAAVTSIPSGPMVLAGSAPGAPAPVPAEPARLAAEVPLPAAAPAAPAPAGVPAGPPDVPALAAHPVLDPADEPDVMASIAALLASGEAWAVAPPQSPAPRRQGPPPVAAAPPAPAPPAPAPPAPAPPRVQLGFRDGTSTTLDPASSQSLALEQLAQSLTRRD